MRPILFADNDPDFLETRSEFLERAGYKIVKATSVAEAERCLREIWTPVAILDIRLENDDDEKDLSGIILIQSELCRSITRVTLTNYPSAFDAFLAIEKGPRPQRMVVVLDKKDGPDVLLHTLEKAFKEYVRINFSLTLDWKATNPFALVLLIEPGVEDQRERLLNRAEEMEDLFRRLFYDWERIRIDRVLWQRDGRVALIVFAFKEGLKPESFVVVCGQNEIVNEEARRFDRFAPKAGGKTAVALDKNMRAETVHFAANAYTLSGNDLENAQTLFELYRSSAEKVFNMALNTLYQETLKAWHQEKPLRPPSAEGTYRQRLKLAEDSEHFEKRLKAIADQAPALDVRIEHTEEKLTIHFKSQSFDYPNPIPLLKQVVEAEQSAWLITAPGTLSGESILADAAGHTWLTDFAEAGLAPVLWNYVMLEAAVRFDWVETKDLQRRHELEHCLTFSDFARPDIRDLEAAVRKPARAIQTIRKLAARAVGREETAYQRGIFLHAAHRLAEFDPALPLIPSDLARMSHILLSMAMIAQKIGQEATNREATLSAGGQFSIVDEKARLVMIGDRKERLAPQPFEVLRYLYSHANQVCSKEELLKEALKGEYDESYLHTLIGRIRKVIEDDPEQPRFLITESNAGYRLVPRPE